MYSEILTTSSFQLEPKHLLKWNETGGVGSTDTWTSVLDWLAAKLLAFALHREIYGVTY